MVVMVEREYRTKLAGVTKKNDCDERIQVLLKDISDYCYEGMPLNIEHERDNPYDENAIKVFCDGDHIGYIKRELAEKIAPFVDQERATAELIEITGGEDGKYFGCNILIKILAKRVAVFRPVEPLENSRETTNADSGGPSIKLYDSAYLRSFSNHDFATWAGRYIEWAGNLPQDAGGSIIATSRKQLQIIRDETSYREKHPVKYSMFDRLIPVGSFREKALPFVCSVLSFAVTMSVLVILFA